jgi:hypothetical protein
MLRGRGASRRIQVKDNVTKHVADCDMGHSAWSGHRRSIQKARNFNSAPGSAGPLTVTQLHVTLCEASRPFILHA